MCGIAQNRGVWNDSGVFATESGSYVKFFLYICLRNT